MVEANANLKRIGKINFSELKDMRQTTKIIVNSDDFFSFFPKIINSATSDKSKIREIYKKYLAVCSFCAPKPTDTIFMYVGDAIAYFEPVKNSINSYTLSINLKVNPIKK